MSLQDIAERAGVDKSTVGKALHDHPKIATKTRDRLKALAREMGYQADPLLAKIATHRWKRTPTADQCSIAVVWSIADQWLTELVISKAMSARASEYGYKVETIALPKIQNKAALSNSLYHRGVQGLILGPVADESHLEAFDFSPFPTVSILSGICPTAFSTIRPNLAETTLAAFKLLLQAGCKRPGMIIFEPAHSLDELYRTGAFLYEQERVIAPKNQVPVLKLAFPDKTNYINAETRNLLTSWYNRHKPDGIIGMNNLLYWWLCDIGCSMPGGLQYISLTLDDPPDERIAGFCVPWDAIGTIAVDSLQTLIRTGQRGQPDKPIHSFVPMHFHAGNTLRRMP
ncbi:MAG: LacI family DNA-binding transcriptional regulator [Verrucomicrobiota bacterium]|nr:LacI family DNA-binding transcriptional regulator [Verrucomicrobiota bacterium]